MIIVVARMRILSILVVLCSFGAGLGAYSLMHFCYPNRMAPSAHYAPLTIAETSRNWRLTGKEVLLELEDETGKHPRGIYALDVLDDSAKPKLLIPYGKRPTWNPSRDRFAYFANGGVYIASRSGKSARAEIRYPAESLQGPELPIRWMSKNEVLVRTQVSSLGTVILAQYATSLMNDVPAVTALLSPVDPIFAFPVGGAGCQPGSPSTEYLAARDCDMSPDGKMVAVETSPLAPEDIRRDESRIYICSYLGGSARSPVGPGVFDNIRSRARRLTRLPEGTCELRPRWSPTGEWISFTVVHFRERYAAPAVCHPDGSGYTELLPASLPGGYDFYCFGPGWVAVAPLDIAKVDKPPPSLLSGWGHPYIWPVEWSDDGKYLLLSNGSRFGYLIVARVENGKWSLTAMSAGLSGSIGGYQTPFAALGPLVEGSRYVIEGPPLMVRAFSDVKKSPRPIMLPKAFSVRWLDW